MEIQIKDYILRTYISIMYWIITIQLKEKYKGLIIFLWPVEQLNVFTD